MLNGNDCTEMGYHPLMFLFMVIVVAPAYMLCLYEPDMNASDATVKQV